MHRAGAGEQLGDAKVQCLKHSRRQSVHQAAGSYSLELLASYKAQGPDPAPPAAPPPKGVAAAMERLLRVPSRHPFSLVHSQDSQPSENKKNWDSRLAGGVQHFPTLKHKDHDQLINPPRRLVCHDSTCPSGFQRAPAWGELELGLQLGELLGELMDSLC
ncbi:hypothetical protein X797_003494 [Metarhizium robertsii]|uniref:Uncharacterized protein n=1 Tax=Metarhizium robertsii TaxID=568076 RepID=A0A0A1V1G3_9HYPO|nr:hypothetical protein X797_003494 [Metarhizium robertsii]